MSNNANRQKEVRLSLPNIDEDDDYDEELLGEQIELEKTFDVKDRPSTLRRNSLGASTRLSYLGAMIQRHSGRDNAFQLTVLSPLAALEEMSRLQWLMRVNLPGITKAKLPPNWAEFSKPRKTISQLQEEILVGKQERKSIRTTEKIPMHEFVRNMALKMLEADIFKKLQVTYNTHVSQMKDAQLILPSFSPFGWTVEDFVSRRYERNTVWLDALLTASEKDLEMLKFKCDMEELFKLLCLLFQGLKPTSKQIMNDLFTYVHDAHEFLKFPQMLKVETKRNLEKLRDQVNTYLDMLNIKRDPEEEAYKLSLEQKLMDLAVIGPIELRYEVNWMHTKADQAIMKINKSLEDIVNKANDFRKEENKESYCARCVLDMYYLDIEKYKTKIAELSARFDNELEKADNEISYKKLTMDKLRDQRKMMESEILRFKEELDEIYQKDLAEKQAEEDRKKEEEMRLLEEAALKAKKGKGKKGKGKKK